MGHTAIVQLLLSNGANVHLSLKNFTTPVFIASQNGHADILQLLLQKYADVNIRRDVSFSANNLSTLISCKHKN